MIIILWIIICGHAYPRCGCTPHAGQHWYRYQVLSPSQTIATYRNFVGRNMLHTFGHHVATRCDMLGVVGSSLETVKFEPTTPNTSQNVATVWPNTRHMLHPTMLQYVALACCDRLALICPRPILPQPVAL